MIAKIREVSIVTTRIWPTGSGRRGAVALDSGTNNAASTRAAIPIGMLIQKIERQPAEATSRPPTTGPAARDRPTVVPHRPIARARSRGSGKACVMIDRATGLSMLAPRPWATRKAINQPRLGAREQASEPTVKRASPAWNTRRRPIRSAVDPASIMNAATARV